ncbi:hypothetical protein EFE40_07625 [Methanohalophilus halophilus]|nr:hypothetical protein EFE40_07625 [Methanohalophilus halophilus]
MITVAMPLSSAAVTELSVYPDYPVVGEDIKINGTAQPDESIDVTVSFNQTVNVSNGTYEYRIDDVEIPDGSNTFQVTSEKVKDLNVRVKILFWITKSADAESGVATVSQSNVPSGTYDIIIDGQAEDGESTVNLTINASSSIKADTQGYFEETYATNSIPPGIFELNAGEINEIITLYEELVVIPPEYDVYDANQNYIIEIEEISAAADDYLAGQLPIIQISQLVDYFLSGDKY